MNLTVLLTSTIFMVACAYLSVKSIKKYISYSKNFEHILYWGLSFILLALGLVLNIINVNIESQSISVILATISSSTETFAWLFQLYAVSYSSGWCTKYDTEECQHCKRCKRKIKRTILTLFCIIVAIVSQVISTISAHNLLVGISSLNLGFNSTGMQLLDGYYAAIHTFILGLIAFKLYSFSIVRINMYYGYVALTLSEIVKLVMTVTGQYNNTNFVQLTDAFIVAAFIVLTIEVHKMLEE